jgi:DNA-binding transcriptional regulator YdaS (Cro superfamily)
MLYSAAMNLKDYLQQRGMAAALAGRVRVSPAFISQLAGGGRPTPPDVAVRIEAATERRVRRWDLRPEDWHRIWPELIGAEGAPALPVEEASDAA